MVEDFKRFSLARVRQLETDDAQAPPLADDWREATLAQLDAWVEERERLIDEFDRRIEGLRPPALSSPDAANRRSTI